MASVSLDEAWTSCTAPPESPAAAAMAGWNASVGSSVGASVGASVGYGAALPHESHDPRGGAVAADRRRDTGKGASQRLCAEMARLRAQLEERAQSQSLLIYIVAGLMGILLVVVLSATWRLQHAVETLLWYTRR